MFILAAFKVLYVLRHYESSINFFILYHFVFWRKEKIYKSGEPRYKSLVMLLDGDTLRLKFQKIINEIVQQDVKDFGEKSKDNAESSLKTTIRELK